MSHLELRADARHTQSQTLSPRLQHAVRLLQMSSLEFSAMLRESLDRNPFLEANETVSDDLPDDAAPAPAGMQQPSPTDPADAFDPGLIDPAAAEDRMLWNGDVSARAAGPRAGDDDASGAAFESVALDTSLQQHLHLQLNVLPLPERDLLLAQAIVESLDDDGYLRTSLDELAMVLPLDPAPDADELQIALRRVQALEPAGVAARSVGECLQLQLPAIECASLRALCASIVRDHLRLLAARDVTGLSRVLGASPHRVAAACDRIRHLDPRPGWRYGSTRVDYAIPDVVVKKAADGWSVSLNPVVVPKLRFNQVYADLFKRHRAAGDADMATQLQEARWTLRNVEQRFSTILDVARSIVRRQRHFFEFGAMAMKPLGLSEIAREVGVHESTVSRVTNQKYMATPVGVFELKYFFSRPLAGTGAANCSGTAVRGLVKEMIEAERADAPLSDAQITRDLAAQGLVVARRTVTKYRQMLRIDPVERRRRLA